MTVPAVLDDPLVMAGVGLFFVAAVVMAVLTAMVRAAALPDVPKLPYLDAVSADRRRVAHEIRRDPARFLTPQGVKVYAGLRGSVWLAAAGWILVAVGIII